MLAKNELEQKLAELHHKKDDVSIRMRAEPDLRVKRKIEIEKGAVQKQIIEVRQKVEDAKNKEAMRELDHLLEENILFLYVECNKARIKASKYVKIPFSCGHKKQVLLRELLRAFQTHGAKLVPEHDIALYERWKRVLEHNESYNVLFKCKQCRKEKDSLKSKFGRRNDKPIGHANIIVRTLR